MDDTALEPLVAEYAKAHLSPTRAERETISSRYDQLQKYLTGRTFQSGSYARFTSTTPVNDLDVIYVLPDEVLKHVRTAQQVVDPDRLNIHQIVDSLAEQLSGCYGKTARIEAQPHSVGIFFGEDHEFSIDVVPAAPAADDKFWVPEVARRSIFARRELYRAWQAQARTQTPPGPHWIKSHPKGYIKQASDLDTSTEGKFRKTAKTLKKWRWSRKRANDAFRLKSFHLELAVARHFQRSPHASCVQAIRGVVGELDQLVSAPQFPDLADPAQLVDRYVSELTRADRRILEEEFDRAQNTWSHVERAQTRDDVRAALRLFLGEEAKPTGSLCDALRRPILGATPTARRDPGEQFLSDLGITFEPQYTLRINARVSKKGFRVQLLRAIRYALLKRHDIDFYVEHSNVPPPFGLKWKVKNTGSEAANADALRGQIYDDDGRMTRRESTLYWGQHYVECYAIKDGICVAADHIDVPIGPKE